MRIAPALCAFLLLFSCSTEHTVDTNLGEIQLEVQALLALPTFVQVYHRVFSVQGASPTASGEMVARTALFSADYRIEAGVEPAAMHLVSHGHGSVVVYLPRARILSVAVIPRPIHQYFVAFRSTWLVGQLIESGDGRAILGAIPEIESSAAMAPIVQRAQGNAETIVEGFLHNNGYSNIVFIVPPAKSSEEAR